MPAYFSRAASVRYLEIPKAACSSIKAALLQSDGHTVRDGDHAHTHPQWRETPPAAAHTITCVRHPIARLVSAYREKLQTGKARRLNCPLPRSANFDDWARWVADQDPRRANRHWRPQTQVLADPTYPTADQVLRFEHLAEQWTELRRHYPKLAPLPHLNGSQYQPLELEAGTLRLLARYYADDFRQFGYPTPQDAPTGYLYDSEFLELQRLAAGRVALEVGAFRGRSTVAIASTARRLRSVDHFRGDRFVGTAPIQSGPATWQKNVDRFQLHDRAELLVGDFRTILPKLDLDEIGFYFYDADHTEAATDAGLKFAHQLRASAIVAVHDYKPGNPRMAGAVRSVDRFREITGRPMRRIGSLAILEPLEPQP